MSADAFNRLVDEISEVGFIAPIQVVPLDSGRYRIIGGEHRWKAAKVVGLSEIPCMVLSDSRWADEDLCFLAGTRIETLNGGVPIENIKSGDKIIGTDGEEATVIGVMERSYEGEIIVLSYESGPEPLHVTPSHRIFTITNGEKTLIPAKDLRRGDVVISPLPALFPYELIRGNIEPPAVHDLSPAFRMLDEGTQGNCSVKGCSRDDIYAHGLCHRCYLRDYNRKRSNNKDFPPIESGILYFSGRKHKCEVSDCNLQVSGRGLCSKHAAARKAWGEDWQRVYRERCRGVPDAHITAEVAWVIGFLVAEAHSGEADVDVCQVGFIERLHRVQAFFESLGIRTSLYESPPNTFRVCAFGAKVSEWLSNLIGHRTKEKHFPKELLFHSNYEVRLAALQGLAEGDGHSESQGANVITTTSIELAYQLRWLISSLGLTCGVGFTKGEKKGENRNDVWTISWSYAKDCERKVSADGVARSVKNSTKILVKTKVYNLETEPQHTYIANGIAVSNCKFTSVRANVIHGDMDPDKFLSLYNELADKYGAEAMQQLLGYSDSKAFQKLVSGVKKGMKKALPKELQAAFDDAAKEVKTVEDLSKIIQSLFQRYGETVSQSFMVFSHGGKNHIYISMSPSMKKAMEKVVEYCRKSGEDINDFMEPITKAYMGTAETRLKRMAETAEEGGLQNSEIDSASIEDDE